MAKIQLNGKKLALKQTMSIYQLLKKYKINGKKVAIEINGRILSKNNYKKKFIKDKDRIEIVQFIGGG